MSTPDPSEADRDAAFVLRLRERGVRDTAVLRAMERVPREGFVPAHLRAHARLDIALPLPCGQSMTAPSAVGAMLGLLDLAPGGRVLEVGTGSGYVTALLLHLGAGAILSLERYATLARTARAALGAEARSDVRIEAGDGLGSPEGWGTFARILVNGLCPRWPEGLCAALAPGGRLVAGLSTPQGPRLAVAERPGEGAVVRSLGRPMRLPPLTPGRAAVL